MALLLGDPPSVRPILDEALPHLCGGDTSHPSSHAGATQVKDSRDGTANKSSGRTLVVGSRSVSRRGFSVVELLVIILVVGVTVFFAVPYSGLDRESAKEEQDRHAAQNIVRVYQAGFAAGVTWNGSTRNAKVDAVISGQAPTEGAFSGKFFKVPAGTDKDKAGAFKYIGCDSNGDLYYDKSGEQPST